MMKLLGFLTYTAFVLVVGALCTWLVLGKGDPNCTLVGIPPAEVEAEQQRTLEQVEAVQKRVDAVAEHDEELRQEVAALRQASELDRAALAHLREEHERAVLLSQQQIERLEGDLASEKRFANEMVAEKNQLKEALKQLRADYINLASKNAAIERASIEELAKAHQEGTKVSKRGLPPIMQAVVNMGGVPSGKQVPRPVLP